MEGIKGVLRGINTTAKGLQKLAKRLEGAEAARKGLCIHP